ncbi:hypothetical protein llap_13347 [Limosa lapponica baueri]|uniref:Uncharacterized protein n=1 Tax=Limosa lapponica baueri TaxID=1758121 RepID=A0A2I0TRC1_LIMLA|nr:hypothetical protein llap_13347 [Limosa lapponica baueri]
MVDFGLVLAIIEDGTEAQISGSGRVRAFTGKQAEVAPRGSIAYPKTCGPPQGLLPDYCAGPVQFDGPHTAEKT